ncbi:MAG: thiol:disulfide interchange protein DsbA/DsbL [Sulfuriferula multivorans]|uniref:Thiol:disulfide interchange protein n=1 Tax=Sulfuriferula multivorans TaxID=1559896 RepID=A0A7C9TC35_9PROT|nr:thiol:disulfide interchange protein DsbA/DsbL [Sulfuriferula multivorans]
MFTRTLALFAAAVFSISAYAASDAIFEGHDYARVKNVQPVATGKKVEVLEFFWYRCPHCFQLEPALNTWLKTLPKDAQVRRVPGVFREDWVPAAKTYYTLEQMGLLDRLHTKVFDAYNIENINLNDPAVLGGWIDKQGVDRKKFESLYNSFSTQSKTLQGGKLATAYAITGVPAFIIDGKYTTSMSMAQSESRLFEILDQLIVKARAERKRK